MDPPDSHRISRVPHYSGYHWARPSIQVRDCHPLRWRFPARFLSITSCSHNVVLQPRRSTRPQRFGLVPVRSPLLGESLLFSSPVGTEMFQFPTFAPSNRWYRAVTPGGLSHSEICGSHRMCQSPQLIAAYHVLHRLLEPRHPPCALICFIYILITHSHLRHTLKGKQRNAESTQKEKQDINLSARKHGQMIFRNSIDIYSILFSLSLELRKNHKYTPHTHARE